MAIPVTGAKLTAVQYDETRPGQTQTRETIRIYNMYRSCMNIHNEFICGWRWKKKGMQNLSMQVSVVQMSVLCTLREHNVSNSLLVLLSVVRCTLVHIQKKKCSKHRRINRQKLFLSLYVNVRHNMQGMNISGRDLF